MRLGTLVTPVGRLRIAKLAREVITLDRLSGGRAVLGVGLGFRVLPEYAGFGDETDPRTRGDMLDEGGAQRSRKARGLRCRPPHGQWALRRDPSRGVRWAAGW